MPATSEKQRRLMEPTEAAYIAGFLDGEGYVTLRRSNRYLGTGVSYRLVIGFTNTDLSVLQWIQEFSGGNINPKSRKSERHSPAFELTIHNRQSVGELLHQVQPFIRIKTKQVELGLSFLALGLVKRSMVARGKAWPIFRAIPEEITVREAMKLKLNEMNKRGPLCPQ